MDFIWFLIVGAVIGWIAGLIYKGSGFGFFGNVVVGIIGAMIGGFLFQSRGLGSSIIVSVIGAVIFLAIIGLVRRGPKEA